MEPLPLNAAISEKWSFLQPKWRPGASSKIVKRLSPSERISLPSGIPNHPPLRRQTTKQHMLSFNLSEKRETKMLGNEISLHNPNIIRKQIGKSEEVSVSLKCNNRTSTSEILLDGTNVMVDWNTTKILLQHVAWWSYSYFLHCDVAVVDPRSYRSSHLSRAIILT